MTISGLRNMAEYEINKDSATIKIKGRTGFQVSTLIEMALQKFLLEDGDTGMHVVDTLKKELKETN